MALERWVSENEAQTGERAEDEHDGPHEEARAKPEEALYRKGMNHPGGGCGEGQREVGGGL